MHGNGDGTFQLGVDYASGTGSSKPQLADLNHDGEIDIAFANFDVNTATTVTVLLNQSGSTVGLTSSAPNSQFGQPIVFNSAITPTVLDSDPPTGTTTITSDGVSIGSGTVAAGKFAVTVATLPVGAHTIAGNYSGDSLYKPKALPSLTQTVVQANTTLTLSTTANPSIFGQPLTVTAKVTPAFTGTPTGTVTFTEGATVLGTLPLDANSSAAIDLSSFPAGTHTIAATYSGDTNFKSSVSATLSQAVFFATTITFTADSNRQLANSPLNVNVKVSSANGTPTGTVQILDGLVVLAQLKLDQTGSTAFSTTTLAGGTHFLSAAYLGDGFFNPVSSSSLTYDVADFSVSATPTTATVSRGQSATFSLTVDPIDGFNGSVSFNCQGLPAFASCSFNPPALTPNGAPASTTLTLTTTAVASTFPWNGPRQIQLLLLAGLLGGLLAALGLARLTNKQPVPLPALRFATLVVAAAGCMLMLSCGGGRSSTPPPPTTTTSNVTVSSTATSGAVSDTHSLVLRITIQ